jgi:predicted RNA-binding protein with RPS1 domain
MGQVDEKGKVSMSQSVTEKEDMSGKDPQSKTPHNVAFRKVHDELRLIKQASRDIKAHQDNIRAMLLALSVPCGTEKSCRKQAI